MAKFKLGQYVNTKKMSVGDKFETFDNEKEKVVVKEVINKVVHDDGSIVVVSMEVGE